MDLEIILWVKDLICVLYISSTTNCIKSVPCIVIIYTFGLYSLKINTVHKGISYGPSNVCIMHA